MSFFGLGGNGVAALMGSALARGAGVPLGPVPFVLPTPSFGPANLLAWYDKTKTFKDSAGVDRPSINYDELGHGSIASWLDMSGNGNDFYQNDKSLQPTKGVNGGAYFDTAAYFLDCVRKSMFNSLTQFSVFGVVVPQVNTNARTLIFASEGNTSAPVLSADVAAGGSGYSVGDQIVLTGGTASTQAVLEVTAVSGGAITSVGIINGGAYTVAPANPVAQGSVTSVSGGASSGTGATFNCLVGDIGNGSSVARFSLDFSNLTGGRKPSMTNSIQDGTQATTASASYQSVGPANGGALNDTTTKRRLGYEIDLVGGTFQPYYEGAADGAPQTIATGRLGNNNSVSIRMGNNATPNRPLAMEVIALVILSEIPNPTRRAQIDAYLAGL